MSKNTRNRILLTAVAALLLVTMAVGGTVAWLQASTDTVTNTFKPTSLNVTLDESGTTANEKEYTMVPGAELPKDPKVDYSTDVNAYVFIVVTENMGENITANNKTLTFDDFINYSVVSDWTPVDGNNTARQEGVYYKEITVTNGQTVSENDVVIIQDASTPAVQNQVTIKESVDKAMMDALKNAGEDAYPTLSFQAYIIQKDNLNVSGIENIYKLAAGIQ